MNKTITVKGVGTASVKPDYITIRVEIISIDKDYSKAVNSANKRIVMLQNALSKAGYAKEDLKTMSFRVGTSYENKGKTAIYRCIYDLKLSFDLDTNRLAETINVIADSDSDAQFRIMFTVKNPEKVNEQLLKSAAENARQKAEVLCAAAGVKLGELIEVNYNWGEVSVVSASSYSMNRDMVRGISTPAPEFEPDDIRTEDSATFVWEIV